MVKSFARLALGCTIGSGTQEHSTAASTERVLISEKYNQPLSAHLDEISFTGYTNSTGGNFACACVVLDW